jgi:hypothetical protein
MPVRGRKFLGLEAPAFLEHGDAIALLGQPERGDGAAEPAAYDDDIEVALHSPTI